MQTAALNEQVTEISDDDGITGGMLLSITRLQMPASRAKRGVNSRLETVTIFLLFGVIIGCYKCLPSVIGMQTVKTFQESVRQAGMVSLVNY